MLVSCLIGPTPHRDSTAQAQKACYTNYSSSSPPSLVFLLRAVLLLREVNVTRLRFFIVVFIPTFVTVGFSAALPWPVSIFTIFVIFELSTYFSTLVVTSRFFRLPGWVSTLYLFSKMSSIYDVLSTLTQTALDAFCQKYHILDTVHPALPGPNQSIRSSPVGKIGVYTRFFDRANFRIPLSRFLEDVLEYFRINLSQLSVIAAAKVSHFEILCNVHAYVPTVGLFGRFYVNSKNKGWLSFKMDLFTFIRHSDPTKVRIGERKIKEGHVPLLDSTKGRVIPLVDEDHHDDQDENIKIVGHDDLNEESGDANQEEVQTATVDKPKGIRMKRKATGGACGFNHPSKKPREDHDTYRSVSASIGGKSSVLPLLVMTAAVATTAVADVSSAPSFLLILYVSQDMDSETLRHIYVPKWNVVNESVLDDPDVYHSVVDKLAPSCFFPSIMVRMRSEHNLRERKVFERKCVRHADMLKEKDAKIVDLKAYKINILKEHNIALDKEKNTLEGHVVTLESATTTKDAELASLNAQTAKLTIYLSILQLFGDELSTNAASLKSEWDGLVDQCEVILDAHVKEISNRVVGLDYELMDLVLHLDEEFYPRFLTTISSRRWIFGHGLRLAVMKCRQSLDYGATFRAVIGLAIDKGVQVGLAAGIDHGKARRGLADVASYDLSMEARCVSAVLTFRNLDFEPSYEQLLLPIHRKEDNVVVGETSLSDSLNVVHNRCQKLKKGSLSGRSSISDAADVLVDMLSSENLIGEASTSGVPTTVVATTALFVSITTTLVSSIPPISMADYEALDAEPQPETSYSSKVVFENKTLETTPEHPTTNSSYGPSHLGPSFRLLLHDWHHFSVFKVYMSISTRITDFVLYVSENGVSSLLDLIMVWCAHMTCGIFSIQSLLPLSNRAFIPSSKLMFALSTKPLACRCLPEAKR
uniref:Putative transposase (Putative), gypsy type n=1 Tax=Tanacetum cinerariifolium TaxID=118510 RepID=A0A699II83_TANCI|nr:putative transposase (putative), gypsy type [Tanacetum cinerariifolium]